MAQLSRPFQIALLAVGLLAAVWFFALHGHSSTSSSTPATPATPAPTASAQPQKAAAPTPVYHGPAPGVTGLTRALTKAHGAVATSQQNAKQLEEKSAQASSTAPSSTGGSPSASTAPGGSAASTSKAAPKTAAPAAPTVRHGTVSKATPGTTVPGPQKTVEAELKHGKIVVLLFWNPKGADDLVTHSQLQLMVKLHRTSAAARAQELRHGAKFFGVELGKKVAVHEGSARAVASYGTITRGLQVYATPTMLIVNSHGKAITLTGATDAYSIEQAIEEDRHS
jgi:hypothetical protein